MTQELDITPTPRVLQMLGEINLEQWRCLAELIDNSIDGFIDASRAGAQIVQPEIAVSIPTVDTENARVSVKDNGPGMSLETLENALRAGWSGNDSLSKLGLFGMGFNIATARLGIVTEVWTSRRGDPEQIGVRIDLDELRSSGNYKVPRQTRAKVNHEDQGTEIVVTRLKPEQRAYLARANNRTTIKKHLAKTYSALLSNSETGAIRLMLGGARVMPLRPCVWDASRSIELPDGTAVSAVEQFDVALAPRRYCGHCMRTLTSDQEQCPTGSAHCAIVETPRRVKGWVGIQRYLDKTDFGIDFIRNGRKIEIGSKDLFVWNDGETQDVEYPIDDPRSRGRFIGEIHLDHCQVSYTKNRFERDDPAWNEMVRVVRGEGPMRPNTARQKGFDGNQSPLYKLFQAFRRTSPQGKNGLWSRIMVVQDNDRALQMAGLFANADADYLTDERWWQLVEEQDAKILGDTSSSGDGAAIPPGFLEDDSRPEGPSGGDGGILPSGGQPLEGSPAAPTPVFVRRPIFELTRKYIHPTYRAEFDVEAFSVDRTDPQLPAGQPWAVRLDNVATRTYSYLVDTAHDVFRSSTMTPLDALLVDLTYRTIEFLRGHSQDATPASVLADFRAEYCGDTRLDEQEIIALAGSILSDICRSVAGLIDGQSAEALYAELSDREKEGIARRMAGRGVADPRALIVDGRYWDYADGGTVRRLFMRHPEIFFDGKYWEDAYVGLDFGPAEVTNDAKAATIARYDAYLVDAIWLADQTPADLARASRDTVIRATCSLRLLRPDVAE
ncbi:ATP-binding protein [Janthinobacterium sp. YR213]|uniref:ATP-binding protein n=1 Tax=Janthinobacterium sp. YR213 TaxID=1881027 RepID=UPI0008897909|nr:ATP-binding protein [Janthinobacterium sp. YR213]SDG75119.1 Histidine kinase-, DNA gyrase B-, and HSP90-like ATPase [Janthinobacterium sp. YR213]